MRLNLPVNAEQADHELSQGFAESFMLGEISCPDLVAFFRVDWA